MKQYISPNLLQTAEQLRDRIVALRPFPEETMKSLREYYRIGLTYSSNALEGNSLTESETKVVIEDGLTIEGKPLRDVYVDFITERIIATQMDLLRLLDDGGVKSKNGGVNDGNGGVNLEELIYDTIRNNPGMNAPALSVMLQKSLRTIQRYLKSLAEAGRVEFRGAPKNGGYHIL
jgi:Fic family protein